MMRSSSRLKHDLFAMDEEKFTNLFSTNGSKLVKNVKIDSLQNYTNHIVLSLVSRPCPTFPRQLYSMVQCS